MIKSTTKVKPVMSMPNPVFMNLERFVRKSYCEEAERFFELPLDMLCIANMNGYFVKVSRSFTEMIGYNEDEMLSRPFTDFFVPDDQVRMDIVYNEVKSGNHIKRFENRCKCKDGSVKWLSWNSVTVPEEGLVYSIARDITDMKESQRWLEKQTEELKEMLRQKEESLRYARYLQHAVTPDIDSLHTIFPQSFIYFAPKEIVSGDFFWMETLSKDGKTIDKDGDLVIMAAADCTGHGVPAAMLTVMCSNALNKAVKEFNITEPGKILDAVCKMVTDSFSKSLININDGMDISLCLFDKNTGLLQWSGANTPLLYIKNGEIYELAATKQPIGRYLNNEPFITHEVQLSKGDMVYLFSDGYASQFGGKKGKKFMFNNFRKLMTVIHNLDAAEQKKIVANTLEQWKGNQEQIDDIMVVGIRV